MAHRYVGTQYNAGAGLPVHKDIGVEPIAIATGRVRFSFWPALFLRPTMAHSSASSRRGAFVKVTACLASVFLYMP